MGRTRVIHVLVVAVLVATFGACHGGGDAGSPVALSDDTITVGSFDFAESELLAEIYSQAMEAKGFHVQRGVRPRSARVRRAGARGRSRRVHPRVRRHRAAVRDARERSRPDAQIATTHDALTHALAAHDVTVLALRTGAGRERVRRRSRARGERYDLHRLSDLATFASGLTIGGPPECERRPLCLEGLGADLWPEVQGVRPARRRRSADARGARRRRGRRGVALHDGSGARGLRPRCARRRSRVAAGRERDAARPHRRVGALRPGARRGRSMPCPNDSRPRRCEP